MKEAVEAAVEPIKEGIKEFKMEITDKVKDIGGKIENAVKIGEALLGVMGILLILTIFIMIYKWMRNRKRRDSVV